MREPRNREGVFRKGAGIALSIIAAAALGLAVLAAPGGAGEVAQGGVAEPQDAVRLLGARCTFCHGPVLMLGFSRRMLDAGGSAALDAFLARHHAPDAEARAAIVDFLANPVGGSPGN